MLLQPYKSDYIISMMKEVEAHRSRSHWKPIINIEVKKGKKIKMTDSRLFY